MLVGDLDRIAADVEAEVFDFGDGTPLPLEEYTGAIAQWAARREADVLYRAAARLTGARRANLTAVLDLLGSGGEDELRQAVLRPTRRSDPEEAQAAFEAYLRAALTAALVDAGAARWQHSWSEPASLVSTSGEPLDVEGWAGQAAAGEVEPVRRRLAGLGVDTVAAAAGEVTPSAIGSQVVAGIMNVVVDGARHDLVILDTGLIIVPGVPRFTQWKVKPRMYRTLTQVPVADLAAMPGHRYIAYEEIAGGTLVRRVPKTYELVLHSGECVRIRWGSESEQFGDGWRELDAAVSSVG